MEGWKLLTHISAEPPLNNHHGLDSGFSKRHDECNFLPSFSSLQTGFWGNFVLMEGESIMNPSPSAPVLVFMFFPNLSLRPYLPVRSLFTGYIFSLSITKIVLFNKVTNSTESKNGSSVTFLWGDQTRGLYLFTLISRALSVWFEWRYFVGKICSHSTRICFVSFE